MNAQEYYLEKYGIDIGLLPRNVSNVIASFWIEDFITPEEEILEKFKESNIPLPDKNPGKGHKAEIGIICSWGEKQPDGSWKPMKSQENAPTKPTEKQKRVEVNTNDPYTYKGTKVLVNKLGISDFEELKKAERELSTKVLESIENVEFTLKGYFSLHQRAFSDLYYWAGKTRNVELSGGTAAFIPLRFLDQSISSELQKVESNIKNLDKFTKEEWVNLAADHFGEIIAIHPFRDGNGRTTRKFIELFLKKKDIEVNWRLLDREKYYKASEKSINVADNTFMEAVFKNIVEEL